MKMLLWDLEERRYRYYIETSTNNLDWQMAVDHRFKESSSWQEATFSPRITIFIRIIGTSNPINEVSLKNKR